MDKREFHTIINQMKDESPDNLDLLESIQQTFEKDVEPISDADKRALKTYPIQFIIKKKLPNSEWTTQLHIWAENGVHDILNIDPMILSYKNSNGDTILMSLVSYALGKYTEKVDYDLLEKILETDLSYEETTKNKESENTELKNVLDEVDINGKSVIDVLIDFAYGKDLYEGCAQDDYLIELLNRFANATEHEDDIND